MAKKKVSFFATKYKNQETRVYFYTKKGEQVSFDAVKRTPAKEKVEFYVDLKKSGRKR